MAATTIAQDPRKRPQQRRSRATVERILTAAAQVLVEDGLSATTDRIAIRAGVSVGSLYQYFPNKGALILELARRHMADSAAVLDDVLRPGRPSAEWLPDAVQAVATLHEDGDLHPKIGSGVLLSAGSIVLGNVRVGDCSKVAAGSVVLHEVPPHTTVAGVPAKVVRRHSDSLVPAERMDQEIDPQA